MPNINETIVRYIAAWNERDPKRRRELVAQTWIEEGSYIDAHRQGSGACRDRRDAGRDAGAIPGVPPQPGQRHRSAQQLRALLLGGRRHAGGPALYRRDRLRCSRGGRPDEDGSRFHRRIAGDVKLKAAKPNHGRRSRGYARGARFFAVGAKA